MKSSTIESESLCSRTDRLAMSNLILGSNVLNLIDSNINLVMYLIGAIRFGSWKVQRLNQALNF